MVLLGGDVHQVAEQEAGGDCRQGGVLQAAGGQLHPGHGPEIASVSGEIKRKVLL